MIPFVNLNNPLPTTPGTGLTAGQEAQLATAARRQPVATIAALKALTPSAGDAVNVLGYYAAGDGGGGTFYYDSGSSATDNGGTIIAPTAGSGRWLRAYSAGAINVRWFGAKGDGVTDDTTAIQGALNTGFLTHVPAGSYVVSQALTPPSPTGSYYGGIIGDGSRKSIILLQGAITGLNFSGSGDKSGCVFSGFWLKGDGTAGSAGISINYLTNGSVIENIMVSSVGVGIHHTKSWYGSIRNVRMSGIGECGLHIDKSAEAVNAEVFDRLFIAGGVNSVRVDGDGYNGYGITFLGCTFEGAKETAVIISWANNVLIKSCYFENNYTDAKSTGGVELAYEKPIDILVGPQPLRGPIAIEDCHFSESQAFAVGAAGDKCLIYVSDVDARVSVRNCFHTGPAQADPNAIDRFIYMNTSAVYPPRLHNIQFDGCPTVPYGFTSSPIQPYEMKVVCVLYNVNLRYTSQIANTLISPIPSQARLMVKMVEKTTTATSFTGGNLALYNIDATASAAGSFNLSKSSYASGNETILAGPTTSEAKGAFRASLTTPLSPAEDVFVDLIFFVREAGDYAVIA